MRIHSILLATALLLGPGAASAQYHDDYHPGDPGGGYYQPPADGADVVPAGGFVYAGIHPIPYDVGPGFCTMQGPHSHPYQPFDANLFHHVNGHYYFVGDPYDFGYAQPMHWYRGHHPVPAEFGDGICYMTWPHRHHYAPPMSYRPYFRMTGGHFVYVGSWDPVYYQHRDPYVRYFNDYYRSYYYGNRYYRVRPRHVWRSGLYGGPPSIGVRVNLPSISVGTPPMPPPRVWEVTTPGPRVYGVPAVPGPRVYGAPAVPAPAHRAAPVAPSFPGGGFVPPPAPAR